MWKDFAESIESFDSPFDIAVEAAVARDGSKNRADVGEAISAKLLSDRSFTPSDALSRVDASVSVGDKSRELMLKLDTIGVGRRGAVAVVAVSECDSGPVNARALVLTTWPSLECEATLRWVVTSERPRRRPLCGNGAGARLPRRSSSLRTSIQQVYLATSRRRRRICRASSWAMPSIRSLDAFANGVRMERFRPTRTSSLSRLTRG